MLERNLAHVGSAASRARAERDSAQREFESALVREQYRSLARLAPYVHVVIVLATAALLVPAQQTPSLLARLVLPAALIAVSTVRLFYWVRERARIDRTTPAGARRAVVAASFLAPALASSIVTLAAVSTVQMSLVEFTMAQIVVWIAVAACSFCLSALGSMAVVVVVGGTLPLIVAFLVRGDGLTTWLAALVAIVACFFIRMLRENFRMFAEIVRSRVTIAQKQREAEEAKQEALAIALTDDLTGLANRRSFQGELADRIGARTGHPFVVGLVDLDGFKPVNDIHGHPVGDAVLRQVGARLADALAGHGLAARMGGDEFAILCDGVAAPGEATALGEEIRAIFERPFEIEGLKIRLTGACGFALFPFSSAEPVELVRLADAALYCAKAMGRGGVAVSDAAAKAGRARGAAGELPVSLGPIVNLGAARAPREVSRETADIAA